jgi:hypothetical protein
MITPLAINMSNPLSKTTHILAAKIYGLSINSRTRNEKIFINQAWDVANKIGTYSVAVLAKENQVLFYVAAPFSTIDLKRVKRSKLKSGTKMRSYPLQIRKLHLLVFLLEILPLILPQLSSNQYYHRKRDKEPSL